MTQTVTEKVTQLCSCAGHFYVSEMRKSKYKDGVFVPIKLPTRNDTKTVNVKIDTGAQVNVMPVKSYRKLGLPTSALSQHEPT